MLVKFVYYLVQSIPVTLEVVFSGGSRPPDKGGGGGHTDPEIKRERAWSPFWSKNKGGSGPPGPSPGSATSFIFLPCFLSCTLFPKLPFMKVGHFLVPPGPCIKTS